MQLIVQQKIDVVIGRQRIEQHGSQQCETLIVILTDCTEGSGDKTVSLLSLPFL